MFKKFITSLFHPIDWIFERLIHHPIYPKDINPNDLKYVSIIKSQQDDDIPFITIEPSQSDPKNCIIYSHGNKANMFSKLEYWKNVAEELNVVVIIYDYIGYGFSDKKYPSEQLCYDSLHTIIEHTKNKLKMENIYLIGRSLGSGVVIDYLSKNEWTLPVILLSPYKTIFTVYLNTNKSLPFDKFTSHRKINNIGCPIKIYHGTDDKIINVSHSKELFECMNNKTLEPSYMENIDHKNILRNISIDEYKKVFNLM